MALAENRQSHRELQELSKQDLTTQMNEEGKRVVEMEELMNKFQLEGTNFPL